MTSDEMPLKPCPFCNGKPRSWEDHGFGYSKYGRYWFNVMCDNCGFFMRDREEFEHTDDGRYVIKYPEKECFNRWNTRADIVPDKDVADAAEKLIDMIPKDWDNTGQCINTLISSATAKRDCEGLVRALEEIKYKAESHLRSLKDEAGYMGDIKMIYEKALAEYREGKVE